MKKAVKSDSAMTAEKGRQIRKVAVWGFLAFTIALTGTIRTLTVLKFPEWEMSLGPPNPDAWIRLAQVRQWLAGGDFFDHTVRNTNAPFGGVSTPWTRPLDMVLALFYFLTPSHLSTTVRLLLAGTWMAPLMCLVAAALIAKTALRHFAHIHVLIAAVMLLIFNSYMADYFSPGDSDHHGMLSTLWCGVLLLVTSESACPRRSLGAGALLGVMVWMSPEGFMMLGPVYALLGLEALFRPRKMTGVAVMTLGAAAVALAALFVERADIRVPVYDSLSIVHVVLLLFTALGAALLAGIYNRGASLPWRMISVALAGIGVLGGMWILYPRFFAGPLADADPFIFKEFLPRVTEAQPLLKAPKTDVVRALTQPLLALFLLGVTFRRGFRKMRPAKLRFLALLSVLMVYTLALTLVQIRWEYYLQPIAIILCAALLPGVSMALRPPKGFEKYTPPRQWRPYLWIFTVFGLMSGIVALIPAKDAPLDAIRCTAEVRYVFQTQQLPKLIGDGGIILYAPENAGGDALFFTPYRIIASNYHREGQGLKDTFALSRAKREEEARAILKKRKVGAMLYCPVALPLDSWLRGVAVKKKYPAWMTPVAGLKFFDLPGTTIPQPLLFKVKP